MPRTGIHNRLGNLKQENPMNVNHYIGFDVHKKSISYCVKTADGTIVEEGTLRATHLALREWAEKRREPWHGAMEATLSNASSAASRLPLHGSGPGWFATRFQYDSHIHCST